MLGFGLWWLQRVEASARRAGEGFGKDGVTSVEAAADDPIVRERATTAQAFDPAEIGRGEHADKGPPVMFAALPLIVMVFVNLIMSFAVLPRLDVSYLAEDRWGSTSLSAVASVWSVTAALAAAISIVMVGIVGPVIALVAGIALGSF